MQSSVGERIRRLRTERGLTQRELAEPRFSRALLAAVESGTRQPSPSFIGYAASRLGVDADELRHGRPPGTAEDLAARLTAARRDLSQGRIDAAVAAFDQVRADAVRYALPAPAAWAAYWRGEAALQSGELSAAEDAFAPALDCPGPVEPRAAAIARWAYCRFAGGDTSGAVDVLEKHLAVLQESPQSPADALVRLGTALIYAYIELDWRERARNLEDESRALLPRVRTTEWVAQFLVTAGQARRTAAELPGAQRMFTEAGRIYAELGLTREIGLCHWAHGYVLRRAGSLEPAAGEFTAACTVLDSVGARQDSAGAALELAEVRRLQGRLDEADALADGAARVCAEFGHQECSAEADRVRGLVAAGQGRPEAARELLARAADRYARMGLAAELATTCRELGDVLLAGGEPAQAALVFRRGLRAAETIR
ncbi:regulatory protein [Actinoplanes sp. SE50]|uniref:helix-turn-helix domain-containing protein n=1 Tax=unclassified Actinoplanes TaxID=2626549 RepID=UPI00023EC8DD|nr:MULTISPECIES: helix-turn-helix transcriptional regulator [unclassified Actinoplanes]AEV82008.1 regulatory protein [Actinoplanes sp. SE50/110]ATO80407.1 regulatory protein [Actinoplanes sp. SE50]SLL97814.1 transcriptional regulator [Actinoplanes sp. SE50/110]